VCIELVRIDIGKKDREMKQTTTAMTMEIMRELGYIPWLTENRATRLVKIDLYNIIDVIGYIPGRPNHLLAVQATTRSQRADHLRKMLESEHLPHLLNCGIIVQLWLFNKKKGRLYLKVEKIGTDQPETIYDNLAREYGRR